MHQVTQNIRSGKLSVTPVPDPVVQPGQVLIANVCSLVSAGTEKMIMDLAKKSLIGKARERPDHVRRVIQKIRSEGFFNTLQAVMAKLDEPMTMGYASAGIVLACGAGVSEFKVGDRVASNGPHAGVVSVPKNLCARLPDNVPFESGTYCVIGAIALQGVRLAHVGLGDTAYVIGLGLIGQITVALLSAAGCRVLATDLDAHKCELALSMGAEQASPSLTASAVFSATNQQGADAVLITAATKSSQPVELAGEAVRQKGRVVAVGAVGLDLPRRPYYFKEAEFVVSCSYGPGRYDASYEDRGVDYPFGHVRWTEQRNMQAVLDLMGSGRLDVSGLTTHRFPIDRGEEPYEMINKGEESYLGILLEYDAEAAKLQSEPLRLETKATSGDIGVGCIGAGNFARMVLLPAISKVSGVRKKILCSAGGLSAASAGEKEAFELATAREADVYADPDVSTVFVITRHDQHAGQVTAALEAQKHVFVEKPLALTLEELDQVEAALAGPGAGKLVMVGFNRRFAPATEKLKAHFSGVAEPLTVSFRFNAGQIPSDHWTQDEGTGGGRIIGEACHAIDLATHLVGSPPVRVYAESIGGANAPEITDDQCFITLRHANGSISNVAYLSGGDKAFPKERIEMFGGGRVGVIDDFRSVTTSASGRVRTQKLGGQDKGHKAEVAAFLEAVRVGGHGPISWTDLRAVSAASILAVRSLREGVPFDV